MELIENIIKAISPKLAARRAAWNLRNARLYEAATNSIYHKKPGAGGSGDKTMDSAREKIRDWARYLDENHDLAIGILDELVNKVIGTGIRMEPTTASSTGKLNRKLNKEIRKLWRDWEKSPDVTGEIPFNEMQRLAARTLYRDGEVLAQHITGLQAGIIHSGAVPYSVEMIECDFLPFSYNDKNLRIVHGVQKSKWGRPTAYYLLKEAPDFLRSQIININSDAVRRIDADKINHIKFTRRLNQTRGVSVFHGVAFRLDDIKDYEESERIAARIGASWCGYIKKGTDFESVDTVNPDGSIRNQRNLEFTPGIIFDDLVAGEEIGTIDTNRPNTALAEFRDSQLRATASGTGTSYSSISKNYNGSWSSQRQEMVESYPNYARLRAYFVSAFLQPIYENFIKTAILVGAIRIPKAIDMQTLLNPAWIDPPTVWVDPKNETVSDILAIDNRLVTRAEIVRKRTGRDPEEVRQQIEAEQLELLESPTWSANKPKPPAPGAKDDDDDDDEDGKLRQPKAA
ncbi:MAG: phage portal protein [Proteobacteria bacterium]|nr:phage portal protein [Pseudomonadota bacterium]